MKTKFTNYVYFYFRKKGGKKRKKEEGKSVFLTFTWKYM